MAKADTVEHTHIWATTYDSTNHWEYCTVCGEKRNVTAHTFTDHWAYGYESCNVNNPDTKTCSCGYSYEYHKPHEIDYSKLATRSKSLRLHSYGCKNCGLTTAINETCTHNGKPITCQNYGACDVCGLVYTQDDAHNVTTSTGTCAVCGKRIYTVVSSNFTYSSDYKKGQFEFKVIPGENVEISDIYWYSFYANGVFTDADVTNSGIGRYNTGKGYTLDSDGKTRIYRWNFSFTKYNSAWYYLCMSTKMGDASYHNEGMAGFTICPDREAPIISEIKQTDQASSNGWATIKQLNISGTENATKYVTLSISDKTTGKKLVDAAKLVVSNNSWSYECTPPLEGDVNGRTYICKVTDDNDNTSTKEFAIYKTDGTAPQVESPLSYTNWTNKAKAITLTVSDYGSGNPQASLEDQTHYQACTKVGDKYQITYNFSDDIIGTKNYDLYLKDALGNARKMTLTVGNIDKNTYTVTYNLNSGSSPTALKTTYTVEDSFTLPQPTRTGYTFTGWTGSNGTTPQKIVTINNGTRENLSYTANWIQTNTINYNVETVYPSWAGDKSHIGGTVNITSDVVSGNNIPVGATATAADGFVFDGWYSSTGELITKDTTIKPLNCNAEDRGRFTNPSNGGSSVYNASTDTYTITTNANPETWKNWGSGVHHISQEIPWNNWYIAEFEVWSPIDAECIIDINNWGPNGHSWSGNDNDNYETRFYNQNGTDSIFSLKANTWKKIIIWYQNSNSKNTNHESLWDQHTIAFRYNESLGSQTFKVRNYKAAVSPTFIKELDTFTARFKPWQHTVTYDANGGTGAPESFQKCTWTSRWISSTVPTKTGYTFKNWNTKKDGTGTTFNPGQQYIPDINGGTATLYAQWTVKTYTNTLRHWAYGMKYNEGNNSNKTYFLIGDTPYTKSYGETYVMDDSWLIKIPNGYYSTRSTGFFTLSSDGTANGFITRDFGYKFVQTDNSSYENLYHELYYRPYDYTITYNLNGGTNNSLNPSTYNVLYGISLKAPTRAGYTFAGWYDENGNKVTGINEGCNATFSSADDLYAKLAARTIGNRTLTAHWSYNPVSVKVPQMLTGDHTGKSQFRVKCDDFKAGNIKITVPDSFPYKQAGKADVTATITTKSGNNIITPSNKVCVYDITTNGLSAGCWSGNFNIGLTLTKE